MDTQAHVCTIQRTLKVKVEVSFSGSEIGHGRMFLKPLNV